MEGFLSSIVGRILVQAVISVVFYLLFSFISDKVSKFKLNKKIDNVVLYVEKQIEDYKWTHEPTMIANRLAGIETKVTCNIPVHKLGFWFYKVKERSTIFKFIEAVENELNYKYDPVHPILGMPKGKYRRIKNESIVEFEITLR